MLYDGGKIALDDSGLLIKRYDPGGAKRIPYGSIPLHRPPLAARRPEVAALGLRRVRPLVEPRPGHARARLRLRNRDRTASGAGARAGAPAPMHPAHATLDRMHRRNGSDANLSAHGLHGLGAGPARADDR